MKETAPSLFKRSKAGDERAFRNIYDNHKAGKYIAALTITRDVQQAEDVTQEAFLKLYKAQHRYRDDSNLGALLFKITRNTALSHVAKARRFPRTLQTWGMTDKRTAKTRSVNCRTTAPCRTRARCIRSCASM